AIELFEAAHALAPEWPYPLYDAAYAHLLKGDTKKAEALYTRVEALAPRGFFTAKMEYDCVVRENKGELPKEFCRAFVALEWLADAAKKRATLEGIVAKQPSFAPAWKE